MDDAKTENPSMAVSTEENDLSTTNGSRVRPQSGEYTVVVKRKRVSSSATGRAKPKKSSLSNTEQRTRYVLLGLIGFLLVVALAGTSTIRKSAATLFHTLFPKVSFKGGSIRIEVVALLIAAVVVLYLIPGVEDRVLRFLGIRKDKKR